MWLNKPYKLALIMYGLVVGVGIIIGIIGAIFGIQIRGGTLGLQWIIAYTIGQVYTSKYKQIMPHQIKLWTVIYYFLIVIIVASLFLLILGPIILSEIPASFLSWTFLIIGVLYTISAPIMYWMLGLGSKAYLKKINKNKKL